MQIRFENIWYVMLIEAQVTFANIHKPNKKCNPLSWELRHWVYICIAQVQALGMCVFGLCVYVGAHVITYCNLHAVRVGN